MLSVSVLILAPVMISRFMSSSPTWDSILTVQSQLEILSLFLSLCPSPTHTLTLSFCPKIKKWKLKINKVHYVIIHHCHCFIDQMVLAFTMRSSLTSKSVQYASIIFWAFPLFLASPDVLGSSCIYPAPILEPAKSWTECLQGKKTPEMYWHYTVHFK